MAESLQINTGLVGEIKSLIEKSKQNIAISVNSEITSDYGGGWGDKQLRLCMKFAQVYNDLQIVYTVCRQLSWSHLRLVMFIDDELKREFYIEMCKLERWSVRTFRERIQSIAIG